MQDDMDVTDIQTVQETSTSENIHSSTTINDHDHDHSMMNIDHPHHDHNDDAHTTTTSTTSSLVNNTTSNDNTTPIPSSSSPSENQQDKTPDCSSTSDESTESAAEANVEQVLAKSKKAATFLWLLLHAQHCPVPHDSINETCPVRGCRQAKRLLLHIKSCPARNSPTAPCPCNYQGCQDARKLLAHYKNARLQRNKQKQQPQHKQQPPSLILTFLARHDKEMTEKLKKKQFMDQQKERRLRMQRLQCPSSISSTVPTANANASNETDSSAEAAAIALTMFTSSLKSSPKTVQFNLNTNTTAPQHHPYRSSLSSLSAAAVSTSTTTTTTTYNNKNNNSGITNNTTNLDSMPPPAPRTRSRTSSVGSISSLLRAAKVKSKRSINARPRAGSLDERRCFGRLSSSLSTVHTYMPNDPTVELELIKPTTTFDIPDQTGNGNHHGDVLPFRKRSVSCTDTISPSRRFCDTIMEE